LSLSEPQTYNEAFKHDCWTQAMKEELDALNPNHTWQLTPFSPGKTSIGCK